MFGWCSPPRTVTGPANLKLWFTAPVWQQRQFDDAETRSAFRVGRYLALGRSLVETVRRGEVRARLESNVRYGQ